MQGIYGIPDDWTARIEDPSEQAFYYEVKALGTHLAGGKLVAKEEPDAGAAVDDGKSKNQKAPPPKGKGKAELQEPEELTPEEEEKQRLHKIEVEK